MRGIPYDDKFLILLYDKMVYFKSHYIYATQETLLKWLRTSGGWEMSRRTLCRKIKRLRNSGLLGSIKRKKRNPMGGMIFMSTLQSIGIVGLIRLVHLGKMTYKQMKEYIKDSIPFRARQDKKEKKGLTPADKGFYKDVKNIGDILKSPI